MERSMELYGPPVKRRRVSNPHPVNHSEPTKDPNLLSPNGSMNTSNMTSLDETPATVCPPDTPILETVVKHDDTLNNGKESLTEDSKIDHIVLEKDDVTSKDDIVMEESQLHEKTELKMDVDNSSTKLDAVKETSSGVRDKDNGHSRFRKKLLVLDINGLLVDIVADPDEHYRADTRIGSKSVFKRPYCDEFLNFCFERFNVGVWTSRTRRNIERVLDFLIKNTQHQLLFCWDQSHCTETGFSTIENNDKPLVLKELKKLWEKEDSDLPWNKGDYDESNTFLLDDSPYKALRNPPYTAIFPYTYSYRHTKDIGLGPRGDLRKYLERLSASDNVQKFIEQNPFGQKPICYKNKSWKFYLKVIDATCPEPIGGCGSKKKLLVVDVNGLFADVVSLPREKFKADTILQYKADTILPGSKAVFKRPHCDEFLKFCFEKFNVGVWSSTSRYNIERAVDFLMRDFQHKLLFCWDQSHCTDTGFRTVENINKPLVLKQLKKLWEKKDSSLPWETGEYDESNTLLLETSPPKALLNPPYTAIFPYSYSHWKTEDNSLGREGHIRVYLERLAECENVKKFVEENPFGGQRPITNKNLSWGFYQKVIRAFSSHVPSNSILPEAGTSTHSIPTYKSEPQAATVTDSVPPTKLETESDSIPPIKLEPEADTVTDSTLPTTSEPESNTSTASIAQTVMEPKNAETNTVLVGQSQT